MWDVFVFAVHEQASLWAHQKRLQTPDWGCAQGGAKEH